MSIEIAKQRLDIVRRALAEGLSVFYLTGDYKYRIDESLNVWHETGGIRVYLGNLSDRKPEVLAMAEFRVECPESGARIEMGCQS